MLQPTATHHRDALAEGHRLGLVVRDAALLTEALAVGLRPALENIFENRRAL
jgi:hypothetical protein